MTNILLSQIFQNLQQQNLLSFLAKSVQKCMLLPKTYKKMNNWCSKISVLSVFEYSLSKKENEKNVITFITSIFSHNFYIDRLLYKLYLQ